MSRRRNHPHPPAGSPAYRQAFERLDEAIQKNTEPDNNDKKTRLLGLAMFGADWDDPEEPDPVQNPE